MVKIANEGEYPKVGGDIFYASEANKNNYRSIAGVVSIAEQEMDNTALAFCQSITPVTKTKMQADIMSDSDGYSNTIDTTNTTSAYVGSDLSGYYYGDAILPYDDFSSATIDTSDWGCTFTGGPTCQAWCNCTTGTPHQFVCVRSNSNSGRCHGQITTCACNLDTNSGAYETYVEQCVAIGASASSVTPNAGWNINIGSTQIDCCFANCNVGNQSFYVCYKFDRVNASCVDVYKDGACLCQINEANDLISYNVCHSGYRNYPGTGMVCTHVIGNLGISTSVYTTNKDAGSIVRSVYATGETETDAETCVTFDVLKASDCSVLSSDNAINTFSDIAGCGECDIIIKYNLCSNTFGCCACLKKYSYVVVTN